MTIRNVVVHELSALLNAHKMVAVAQRLYDEAPDDRALAAKLEVAQAEKREATALLKAALQAHGYTYAQLQSELSQVRSE